MKKASFIIIVSALFLLPSCVSKRQYLEVVRLGELDKTKLQQCETYSKSLANEIETKRNRVMFYVLESAARDSMLQVERRLTLNLAKDNNFLRQSNNNILSRLSDLSVINSDAAASIRESMKTINEQNAYIMDLNRTIQTKDSVNVVLVMNLKRSLADINDDDVQVDVRQGVVFISISDKMLYKSGSADVGPQADVVLGKISKIINDHKELEVMVEGHTDNVPIATEMFADNWDLSVKRATSVVRALQWRFGIDPKRITAGGRSYYQPKADNSTIEGRQLNRRTEIILLPQLDQFFKLLEAKR